MTAITFRPLHDFVWDKPRKSRLGFETKAIGESAFVFGSISHVKESIFRAAMRHQLDWTWSLQRRNDLETASSSPCWQATRIR